MTASIADCRLRKSRRFHRTLSSSSSTNNRKNNRGMAIHFTCAGKPVGYYADPDFECRIFHVCDNFGRRIPMNCPPQTMFNQMYRVCDWEYNVDCPSSKSWYHVNTATDHFEETIVTNESKQSIRRPVEDLKEKSDDSNEDRSHIASGNDILKISKQEQPSPQQSQPVEFYPSWTTMPFAK